MSESPATAAASVAHLGLGLAWIGDSGPIDVVGGSLSMHGPAAIYSAAARGIAFRVSIGFMPGWWKRDRRRYNRMRRKAVRAILHALSPHGNITPRSK